MASPTGTRIGAVADLRSRGSLDFTDPDVYAYTHSDSNCYTKTYPDPEVSAHSPAASEPIITVP